MTENYIGSKRRLPQRQEGWQSLLPWKISQYAASPRSLQVSADLSMLSGGMRR